MKDSVSGIEFVRIPAGCFPMGADLAGRPKQGLPISVPAPDELPRHEVCVTSFWMGKSEVTREQWTRVTGKLWPGLDRPASEITWHEAMRFVEQLSSKSSGRFRLPTEAEWEYACHAGAYRPAIEPYGDARTRLFDETDKVAWFQYQAGRNPEVRPVMNRAPNAWGLYDMLGNVWEWTADGYDPAAYARHARNDPFQPPVDERRVMRGGAFKTDIARVRCGVRSFAPADERMPSIGLRVVREIDSTQDQEVKR